MGGENRRWLGALCFPASIQKGRFNELSILMGLFSLSKNKKKEEKIKLANDFIEEIKKKSGLQPITTTIMLKRDEKAFLLEENVIFRETRSVSKRSGAGLGFRLFKGVYVGGYKGEARSHPELRDIDNGSLILTNKRLVFDGSIENKVINLDKILSIQVYLDSIEISIEDKSKSSFFVVKNPYIWGAVFNIIRGVPDPENLKDVNLNIKFE